MTRARASACLCAAVAAVVSACTGDARRADSLAVPSVRIGTFVESRVQWLAGMLSAEPLVSVDWDGRPLNRLAEAVEESSDGTQLLVTLRANARFHNGEPVTAAVVSALLKQKLSRNQTLEVQTFEPVDDRKLIVRLKRPYSVKAVDLVDLGVDDDARPELRTGPFRIVSMTPQPTLEPFKQYYDGAPAVKEVKIHFYPNHRAALTAMMRGEINFLHEVSRDALDFVEAGGSIRAYPLLRPFTVVLAFNQKHPTLRRREVRVALSEAVDRNEVVRNGMRGYGLIADGPFWPHHWAYPSGVHSPTYNPKAAALRLDAIGLPLRAPTTGRMPARFSFTCLVVAGDTRFERIALVVQRQLFSLGIDMQLQQVPDIRSFGEIVQRGDYDAFMYEMASGRALRFPYRFWHSKAPVLPTGYSAADDALDRMMVARTDEETRAAVSDVMRIFRHDPPALFLAFPREARAADTSFQIPYEADRDVFGTFRKMTLGPLSARRDQ